MKNRYSRLALLAALWALALPALAAVRGADLPARPLTQLAQGQAVSLIVEYDVSAEDSALLAERNKRGLARDDQTLLDLRHARYQGIKDQVEAEAGGAGVKTEREYSHLPMSYKRFASRAALERFVAHGRIKAVFEDRVLHRVLAQSLPLIEQPAVAAAGDQGAGTTVAVIDDGIEYTRSDFGSCTAPGVPASCKVVVSQDFGSGTTDKSHGTNVSAIVLGVAPASRVAMLNAFSGTTAAGAAILSAMNWAIANVSTYNIVAMNLSLGDGSKNTTQCSNSSTNFFISPVTRARAVGISVVVAAGNDMYTDALSWPACTPNVISVGAVYDANNGALNWGSSLCTDATTTADQVTCFSDSASFLTLLAPGALITAGGYTMGGTSQATPHVAGAVAVLRAAFPSESLSQTLTRLTTGVPVTDPRNGLVKPRLDLVKAAYPANDAFANRITLTAAGGTATGSNAFATVEAGEPAHGGLSDTHSVWYSWKAPANGQFVLKTAGSAVDLVAAAYTGSALTSLVPVAADATAGGATLVFEAQSGVSYALALDGISGGSGALNLAWSFNSAPNANLRVSMSVGAGTVENSSSPVTVTATNAGPQIATGVLASVALPAGTHFVSGDSTCVANGQTVTCALGTLAANAAASASFLVGWEGAGSDSLTATVSSEVSDPTPADNTTTAVAQVQADAGDVPVMPPAGLALLALLLLGASRGVRRQA